MLLNFEIDCLRYLIPYNKCYSKWTTKAIIDDLFSILIEESHDMSDKKQVAFVLHYINKKVV